MYQVGRRRKGYRRMGGGRGAGHLTNPATKLLELLFRKKLLAVLGEELVDPQVKGFLLDPKFILGSDKDPSNGAVGLLVAGTLLVSFTMDSSWVVTSRVVTKANMSGIGMSTCDQFAQHFLFHFRPNGVGERRTF